MESNLIDRRSFAYGVALGAAFGATVGGLGALGFIWAREQRPTASGTIPVAPHTSQSAAEKPQVPEDKKSFVIVPNKDIQDVLHLLPEVWSAIIRTDYTAAGNALLELRREWRYDPLGREQELGRYLVGQSMIVIPSVWSPYGSNDTSLRSEITGVIHHELGHFTLDRLVEGAYY